MLPPSPMGRLKEWPLYTLDGQNGNICLHLLTKQAQCWTSCYSKLSQGPGACHRYTHTTVLNHLQVTHAILMVLASLMTMSRVTFTTGHFILQNFGYAAATGFSMGQRQSICTYKSPFGILLKHTRKP
jgi:hypothetical protein